MFDWTIKTKHKKIEPLIEILANFNTQELIEKKQNISKTLYSKCPAYEFIPFSCQLCGVEKGKFIDKVKSYKDITSYGFDEKENIVLINHYNKKADVYQQELIDHEKGICIKIDKFEILRKSLIIKNSNNEIEKSLVIDEDGEYSYCEYIYKNNSIKEVITIATNIFEREVKLPVIDGKLNV